MLWVGKASAATLALGIDIPYSMTEERGAWSVDQALENLRAQDIPLNRRVFSEGYSRKAYWLRFEFPAERFTSGEQWLKLQPNFTDEIRIFYRPKGSVDEWQEKRAGDLHAGQAGDIDYRFATFIIPPDDRGYEVLLRIASSSAMILQLELWSPAEFTQESVRSTAGWGFYFGLASLSTALALTMACIFRTRLLWSITAMSAPYLLVACIQGYLAWMIPDFGRLLQHYLTSGMTLLSYAMLLWMTAEALELNIRLPGMYRAIVWVVRFIVLLLLGIPLGIYGEVFKLNAVVYILTSGLCILSTVYLGWRDRPPLSFWLLCGSPLLCIVFSICGLFSALGWIPFQQEIYLIWQYGVLVNMVLTTVIAVVKGRESYLREVEAEKLARELQVEREARFHQRQFMGLVAHEFRTPLAIITGSLENLQLIGAAEHRLQVRYERIGRATNRLVQLTDNCLADARLDAGALFISREPTDLFELISSAALLVRLSDLHEWALTVEGQKAGEREQHEALASVDPALMRIALSNVLDNAVKYTRKGVIQVDLCRGEHGWSISVSDSGQGVDPLLVDRIFERYRQANGTPHGPGGVGLGLYVSRQIAREHGGDLTLSENSPTGCRFTFFLPFCSENF